jgi:hypothetical protein
MNAFVLDAVRRVSWDLGMKRGLWRVQVATLLMVCVPAFQYGHFEDVLALTFLLHAFRYLMQRRPIMAAVLLSLAISSKQWAVLALPLFLFSTERGRRMMSFLAASALPLLFAAIVLATDARHGYHALFSPSNPRRTDPGHMSFLYTWFGSRTSRATRTASVLLSPIVAFGLRNAKSRPSVLATLSVLLLLRPLFEPMLYAYYLTPSLCVAGLVGVATHNRFRIRDWIWQVAAVLWALPHGNPSTAGIWWTVELLLLAITWIQVAINCGYRLPFGKRAFREPTATAELAQSVGS